VNILIVNMSIDPVLGGGTVERTCQLAKALQKLPDTNSKVLSTTAGLNGSTPLDDLQSILLPCLNSRWYIPAPYFRKIYRSIKWADVVILTSHWTLINAMVYLVNKFVKRPYLFCPAGALHIFGRSTFMKWFYNAIVGTSILNQADQVIAIPNDEKEHFFKLGVPKDRIVCIPNGVAAEDFICSDGEAFKVNYGLSGMPFLLFVGRLNEIKGPDILLQAFARIASKYPAWHLVIAGPDGGMGNSLKQEIGKQDLKNRVHLIGFVSGKEKSKAYYAADILVIPSRLEAMSIVALEAGICGTPVVMTDQCGFSEMVEAGAAVEVSARADSLANVLCGLLDEPGCIQDMGVNAKHFISENYTWEIAAKKHRQLCEIFCFKPDRI